MLGENEVVEARFMNGYIQRLFGFICHRPRIGEMANYVTLNTCYSKYMLLLA